MHLKRSMIAAVALFCLLASSSALACACCAEHGTYSVFKNAIDSSHLGVIREINFDKTAQLYMTEAAFDSIRGLGSIEKEMMSGDTMGDLSIVGAFTRNSWNIQIKPPGGNSGTLVLPRPARMTVFKVDTHEPEVGHGEAVLYKEFRFNGTVASGSGIFRGSIVRPTAYELVFQGRGNDCDNASDFTHWHLEIKGSKASYAFFGKLATS